MTQTVKPVAIVTSEAGADIKMSWWHEPALPVGTQLYTEAPRQWVGLTPTDIADALGPCPKYFSEWTDADVIYFARTLEAKLKEKNT